MRRVPTAELVAEAFDLAAAREITAHDACYVALARHLRVPLVTADEALARKLATMPDTVLWLGDLAW